jgi:Uma2 family endonuclease
MEEGVRELWFIIPEDKVVHTHIQKGDEYRTLSYINPREIPVSLFEGFTVDFTEIFPPGTEDEE